MHFLKKIFLLFLPPPQWRVPVVISLGILFGLGILTLYVGNATSYLSDKPEACINCHVMYPQYSTWQHGSHGRVTVCNDCHVPHDNVFRKFAFKASDGLRHSTMFTFRMEPQVIRVKEAGINVIQENCVRCHSFTTQKVIKEILTVNDVEHGKGKLCWDCHRETPHGKISSLASTPFTLVPKQSSIVPEWMKNYVRK